MLSTEDSKIKKLEMTLGTELKAISTCIYLDTDNINDTDCAL